MYATMRFLVLVVLVAVVVVGTPVTTTALPPGCSINGTQLVSCSGFTGSGIFLTASGLTSIQSGAFNGLTSLKQLYVLSPLLSMLEPAGSHMALRQVVEQQRASQPPCRHLRPTDIVDSTVSAASFFRRSSLTLCSMPWPNNRRLDLNHLATLPVGIFDKLTKLTEL